MTAIDHYEQYVRVDGGHANVVSHGDLVLHEQSPGYWLGDMRLRPAELPADARQQPSRLLATAHEVVPFTGRERELRDLSGWRDSRASFDLHLISGPGGQGKTRLATEFARRAVAAGWTAIEARPDPLRISAHRLTHAVPLGERGRLVVIDYAERWPVATLLAVLSDARLHAGANRVLLLARPAGAWWKRISGFVREHFGHTARLTRLGPLAEASGDRAELFRAARDGFAAQLGVPGVRSLSLPRELRATATPLDIQMTALAGVYALARDGGRVPTDPAGLSAYLLDREHEHWAKLHDGGLSTRPETMARAVYVASLTGPLPRDVGVALVEATGLAAAGEEQQRLFDDHDVSYPPGFTRLVLHPLHPDRIAEDFVALQSVGHEPSDREPDSWTGDKPVKLLQALVEAAPGRAVDTLLRMAVIGQRWEGFAVQHLSPLVRDHAAVFVAAGDAVLTALAAVRGLGAATLAAVETELPVTGPAELMDPAATLTARLRERLVAAGAPEPQVTAITFRLARRLVHAGRHAEALPLLAPPPADDLPASYRALQLGYHARALDGLGRSSDALGVAERAVRTSRSVLRGHQLAQPDLAALLDLYARLLHHHRRSTAAATQQAKAIATWRTLDRQAPRPAELATALSAQARYCTAAFQHQQALDAARKAIPVWRAADRAAPGRHTGELLDALRFVADSRLASLPERLDSAAAAAQGYWDLWHRNFSVLPYAAAAWRTWAEVLGETRRHGEALERARKARNMSALLARRGAEYADLHAATSMTYARACGNANRNLEDGLADARTAIKHYRAAGDRTRRAEAERLSAALLRALGRDAEAEDVLRRQVRSMPKYEGVFERAAQVSRQVNTSPAKKTCGACSGSGLGPRVIDGRVDGRIECWACWGSGVRI